MKAVECGRAAVVTNGGSSVSGGPWIFIVTSCSTRALASSMDADNPLDTPWWSRSSSVFGDLSEAAMCAARALHRLNRPVGTFVTLAFAVVVVGVRLLRAFSLYRISNHSVSVYRYQYYRSARWKVECLFEDDSHSGEYILTSESDEGARPREGSVGITALRFLSSGNIAEKKRRRRASETVKRKINVARNSTFRF